MSETMNIMRCVKDAESAQTRDEAFALFEAAENGIAALEGERDALRVYAVSATDALGSLQEMLAKQIIGAAAGASCAACGHWWKDAGGENHAPHCPVNNGLAIIDAALAKNPNPTGPMFAPEASAAKADAAEFGINSEASGAGGAGTRSEFETGRKFTITATVTEKERDPLYLGDDLDELAQGACEHGVPSDMECGICDVEPTPTPMMQEAAKLHDKLRHQSGKKPTPRCDLIAECAASDWEKNSRLAALAYELEREQFVAGKKSLLRDPVTSQPSDAPLGGIVNKPAGMA